MQPDIKYLQTRREACGIVIKIGQFKGGSNSVGKAVNKASVVKIWHTFKIVTGLPWRSNG